MHGYFATWFHFFHSIFHKSMLAYQVCFSFKSRRFYPEHCLRMSITRQLKVQLFYTIHGTILKKPTEVWSWFHKTSWCRSRTNIKSNNSQDLEQEKKILERTNSRSLYLIFNKNKIINRYQIIETLGLFIEYCNTNYVRITGLRTLSTSF